MTALPARTQDTGGAHASTERDLAARGLLHQLLTGQTPDHGHDLAGATLGAGRQLQLVEERALLAALQNVPSRTWSLASFARSFTTFEGVTLSFSGSGTSPFASPISFTDCMPASLSEPSTAVSPSA